MGSQKLWWQLNTSVFSLIRPCSLVFKFIHANPETINNASTGCMQHAAHIGVVMWMISLWKLSHTQGSAPSFSRWSLSMVRPFLQSAYIQLYRCKHLNMTASKHSFYDLYHPIILWCLALHPVACKFGFLNTAFVKSKWEAMAKVGC